MRWATRRRLNVFGAMAAVATATGGLYGMMVTDGLVTGLMRGVVTGLLIAVPLAAFELFYVRARRGEMFRRLPFGRVLALKTAVYVAIILLGLEGGRLIIHVGIEPLARAEREFFWNTVFALAVAAIVTFVMQVRRMFGHGVFENFVLGRYHTPREETRVFLFLDLVGSTALAERLAGRHFLELLNRVYLHITEPIAEHGGEIHKYVGDEVIVTWRGDAGFVDANCVRCVFAIEDQITAMTAFYEDVFGHVPRFRSGLHFGPVVSGEIGDIKQEIAFLGDGMNTAARLVDLCRARDRECVASAAVLERLTLPEGVAAEPLGDITLRGKREALAVFALARRGWGGVKRWWAQAE